MQKGLAASRPQALCHDGWPVQTVASSAVRLSAQARACRCAQLTDRKSTRLNSSHTVISYAVFCLKKKIYRMSFLQTFTESEACLLLCRYVLAHCFYRDCNII